MTKINLKALEAHALRTGAILRTASMHASGWNVHGHDEIRASGPQTFGYIWDQPTNWVWMVSAPRTDFTRLAVKASNESKHIIDDIRSALAYMIYECALVGTLTAEQEYQLAGILTSYAGTTKAWEAYSRMSGGGNFIALNYRKSAADKTSMLRPFIIADKNNEAIPAIALMERIKRVIDMDSNAHPEWFKFE